MAIQWLERDGGRELRITADTQEALFGHLTRAFGELVDGTGGVPDRVPMLVGAVDRASLIGAFVDDLLYLADVESFTATRLERLHIDGLSLRAAVSGWTGCVQPLFGSVQASDMGYDQERGGWRATVVFA
jgi:SHS2 domain-containing protein